MASARTLGSLALQRRLVDGATLEACLRRQRQGYLQGDFRRLGEVLVERGHCTRVDVHALLAEQGVTVLRCPLCGTRYNGLRFRGQGRCLRCGHRLAAADPAGPLAVEDAVSGGGREADRLLEEQRQRNPRLGRYEVLGLVGRGNMGVIYKAWEEPLQRTVALKFLYPEGGATSVTEEDRERFRREGRAVARLRHEHVVAVHAIEERNGLVYLVMDFVRGVPMDRLVQEGLLKLEPAVEAAAKVARALDYVHAQGILHRDVKPSNVMLDPEGRPYLVDFGIAKFRAEDHSVTGEGEVLGSLAYMAPEYVVRGREALDPRCDVYGLGVVLYEALSGGALPYGEPDDPDMITRIVRGEPTPILDLAPDLPADLGRVIMRALARDPDDRYASAGDLAQDLEASLRRRTGRHRRPAARSGRTPEPSGELARPMSSGRVTPGLASEPEEAAADEPTRGFPPARRPAAPASPAPPPPPRAEAAPAPPPSATAPALTVAVAAVAIAALLGAIGLGLLWRTAREDALEAEARARSWREAAGQAHLEAGRVLERAGDPVAAEAAYTRAIEALPGEPAPLEARAAVRAAQGDVAGAAADRAQAGR